MLPCLSARERPNGRDPLDDDTAHTRRLVSRSRAGRPAPVLGRRRPGPSIDPPRRSPPRRRRRSSSGEPTAQAPSGSEHVGSHRAPEPDPEPLSVTEQPTTKVPLRDWTPEPPPELSDWASEPAPEPTTEPTTDPTPEQTPEPSLTPAPLSLTEQPTTRVPLREPAPYADATTSTPPEPQAVEPPAGTEPQAPVDNRKLVMGFGGAVAGLLLVLILAAVYAFVIHKPDTVQLSSPTTETSTTTVEETTTRTRPPRPRRRHRRRWQVPSTAR